MLMTKFQLREKGPAIRVTSHGPITGELRDMSLGQWPIYRSPNEASTSEPRAVSS